MSLLVTAAVSPLMAKVVKPVRQLVSYKRRTIWWTNPESELRILACVHTPRQAPSFVSLLDISHPTKRSPIFVYALHLVELTGRAAAMLVVNSDAPTATTKDYNHHQHLPALGRIQAQSDAITHIFESYEQHAGGVTTQSLTAFTPYATMHEDIIAVAEDRHAALILLPFHKHQTVDGGMEVVHQAIRSLNQAVLAVAPCSVGILVDRGLGAGGQHTSRYLVALLFFGGADDREALAFAGRMADHPRINLKVVRFVYREGENQHHHHHQVAVATGGSPKAERVLMVMTEEERERRLDEDCFREFQARWGGGMVEYEEVAATNAEETVVADVAGGVTYTSINGVSRIGPCGPGLFKPAPTAPSSPSRPRPRQVSVCSPDSSKPAPAAPTSPGRPPWPRPRQVGPCSPDSSRPAPAAALTSSRQPTYHLTCAT